MTKGGEPAPAGGRAEPQGGAAPTAPGAGSPGAVDRGGPLAGLRVVVTRPAHQADGLCAAFAAAGANVERLPLLDVVAPENPEPLRRAAERLADFRWVAFTSTNAVAALLDALGRVGGDRPSAAAGSASVPGSGGPTSWTPGVRAAAVGEATAGALRQAGIEPALVAPGGTGASLADEMAAADPRLAGARVLLPLAADARPDLQDGLAAAGAVVESVVAYDKRAPDGTSERMRGLFPPAAALGWVTFTSPRIARTFVERLDRLTGGERGESRQARLTTLRAASIGPTTSAALRRLGIEPAAEAATPGDEELVAAVVQAVAGAGR